MSDGYDLHEETVIAEGNAPLPGWYVVAVVVLVVSVLIYLGDYLVGAQPTSAQMRGDEERVHPAAASDTPDAP